MVRGKTIGYMTIDSSKYATYGPDEGALAQAFADEVSIAIEHARLFKEVQLMAVTDSLTGLYNRRYFFELSRHEIQRASRYEQPLSLIMLDLDNLKKVNDTYGHHMGDQLIKSIASLCLATLRSVDLVARIGGDEFVILLPSTPLDQAFAAAKRLCRKAAQIRIPADMDMIRTTVSIGVVQYEKGIPDIDALLARADEALYLSKTSGKNKVTILK